MFQRLPILFLSGLFAGCATIFNTDHTNVEIQCTQAVSLVLDQDTIRNNHNLYYLNVRRSRKPLVFTLYNDSLSRTYSIRSRNSAWYYLNFYPSVHLWSGLYIDTRTKRRYTYPKTIYVDLADSLSAWRRHPPFHGEWRKGNLLKTGPFKPLALVNPSIELLYERRLSPVFSMQVMGAWLLPGGILDIGSLYHPMVRGFRTGIESRFYLEHSAPEGYYLATEFQYLKTSYRDISLFGPKPAANQRDISSAEPDTIGINKETYSVYLKAGKQILSKSRFCLDFYGGIGARYRVASHTGRRNPDEVMYGPIEPNLQYISNREGKDWHLILTSGWRITYNF